MKFWLKLATVTSLVTVLGAGPAFASSGEYTLITDDSGALEVEVPVEWSDIDGSPIVSDEEEIEFVSASPDLDAFNSGYEVPGMVFGATEVLSVDELLDLGGLEDCTSTGAESYDDGLYAGQAELWTDCGGTTTDWLVIAAEPTTGEDYRVFVGIQMVDDSDAEAAQQILDTFMVVGEV
jgi:serine protease Do